MTELLEVPSQLTEQKNLQQHVNNDESEASWSSSSSHGSSESSSYYCPELSSHGQYSLESQNHSEKEEEEDDSDMTHDFDFTLANPPMAPKPR